MRVYWGCWGVPKAFLLGVSSMPPLTKELTIHVQTASPERGVQERKNIRAGKRVTESGSQRGEPGVPRGLLGCVGVRSYCS